MSVLTSKKFTFNSIKLKSKTKQKAKTCYNFQSSQRTIVLPWLGRQPESQAPKFVPSALSCFPSLRLYEMRILDHSRYYRSNIIILKSEIQVPLKNWNKRSKLWSSQNTSDTTRASDTRCFRLGMMVCLPKHSNLWKNPRPKSLSFPSISKKEYST